MPPWRRKRLAAARGGGAGPGPGPGGAHRPGRAAPYYGQAIEAPNHPTAHTSLSRGLHLCLCLPRGASSCRPVSSPFARGERDPFGAWGFCSAWRGAALGVRDQQQTRGFFWGVSWTFFFGWFRVGLRRGMMDGLYMYKYGVPSTYGDLSVTSRGTINLDKYAVT